MHIRNPRETQLLSSLWRATLKQEGPPPKKEKRGHLAQLRSWYDNHCWAILSGKNPLPEIITSRDFVGFTKSRIFFANAGGIINIVLQVLNENNRYIISWMLHQIFMYSNKVISSIHSLYPIPTPPAGWTNCPINEFYIS